MYRVGMPFWRAIAKNGATVRLLVEIKHDEEAGVYFASSPDLRGLVVEAETLDELRSEIMGAVEGLMDLELEGKPHHAMADLVLRNERVCFA